MQLRCSHIHIQSYSANFLWSLVTYAKAWPLVHLQTDMAETTGIYAEDIVKNSQGIVGLVLEDAEETSDESDSEEEALKKGHIVVCWYPSGNEETLSLTKVIFYLIFQFFAFK